MLTRVAISILASCTLFQTGAATCTGDSPACLPSMAFFCEGSVRELMWLSCPCLCCSQPDASAPCPAPAPPATPAPPPPSTPPLNPQCQRYEVRTHFPPFPATTKDYHFLHFPPSSLPYYAPPLPYDKINLQLLIWRVVRGRLKCTANATQKKKKRLGKLRTACHHLLISHATFLSPFSYYSKT